MIAASGFLSLFSLKSPFFLFLFCIIDHMLADFEKERNFSDSATKLKHIFLMHSLFKVKWRGGGGKVFEPQIFLKLKRGSPMMSPFPNKGKG